MTLHELAAALTPIAERFAHDFAMDQAKFPSDHSSCPLCRDCRNAYAILFALVYALDAPAQDWRPELLSDLAQRVRSSVREQLVTS